MGKTGRSGRKSAYKERADATMLAKMFFDKHQKNEIKEMIARGEYSIKDAFIAKAFHGNERCQLAIFNKLFPDKVEPGDTNFIVQMIIKKGNADKKEGDNAPSKPV